MHCVRCWFPAKCGRVCGLRNSKLQGVLLGTNLHSLQRRFLAGFGRVWGLLNTKLQDVLLGTNLHSLQRRFLAGFGRVWGLRNTKLQDVLLGTNLHSLQRRFFRYRHLHRLLRQLHDLYWCYRMHCVRCWFRARSGRVCGLLRQLHDLYWCYRMHCVRCWFRAGFGRVCGLLNTKLQGVLLSSNLLSLQRRFLGYHRLHRMCHQLHVVLKRYLVYQMWRRWCP